MAIRLGLALLLAVAAVLTTSHAPQAQGCDPRQVACLPQPSGPAFKIAAYNGAIVRDGGKCLTYEAAVAGAAVFLSDCDVAQPFRVHELKTLTDGNGSPIRNHVYLSAGNLVLGVKTQRLPILRRALGGALAGAATTSALELQPLATSPRRFSDVAAPQPRQVFALDGDSIMLASDRSQVVQVLNGRGADGTPVVLGPRALAEWEFWEFQSLSDSHADPTDAFVNVSTFEDLLQVLAESGSPFPPSRPATFGTVVRITQSMLVTSLQPLIVPPGVTVRGDRRGTRSGPELWMIFPIPGTAIFVTGGPDVRITNLRLRGPNVDRDRHVDKAVQTRGVDVLEPAEFDAGPSRRIYVDNNDIGDFHWNGIRANGRDVASNDRCNQFGAEPNWRTRPNHLLVVRNFIHHHLVQDRGYGVGANSGGYPLVYGNTFVTNRHAIAGTNSTPRTGYRAVGNLVLRHVPVQEAGPFNYLTHDFDMHGTGEDGKGGIAGGYIEVAGNTFLGLEDVLFSPHHNFEIRGKSCDRVDFYSNVSLQEKDDAVSYDGEDLPGWIHVAPVPNQFEHANPTRMLRTGDFDGDGLEDLFLATGTAFYYSPGGNTDWRLLAIGRTDPIESLLFGDFDGDGRTDVIGKNGGNIMVSWGGSAEWEALNTSSAPIADLAVGNFDGDDRDDIFHADGQRWRVSSGGSAPFVHSATSGFRVPRLRFGDFNNDGETDVFSVVSDEWSVSYGARSSWTPLPVTLTNSVDRLFVGDFDGDGRADVATWNATLLFGQFEWRFWRLGARTWAPLTTSLTGPLAGIGHFRGGPPDDLLFWDRGTSPSDHIYLDYPGSPGRAVYSRQAMR